MQHRLGAGHQNVVTLQMKGRWESNINVWLPFMYSQKYNCYFQNRIIMFCLPIPTLIYLLEIYTFPGSVCLFCCKKYVDWSWEYINRSQTHKCGNWYWGHAIPRKGIYRCNFLCSAYNLRPSGFNNACAWHNVLKPEVFSLQRQNTEISKQIFPEKEYRGLSPNFHIHASVSNLYCKERT